MTATRAIALSLGLATLSVQAEAAQEVIPSQAPSIFHDVGVTMQSRICGELLGDLAYSGVQSLKVQFPAGVPRSQRGPVYETSAQAIVLLSMSGSLKLDERLRAGEVSQAIEKMSPQVQVDTAKLCQRRVATWIRLGEVAKDTLSHAYAKSRPLMDQAFDSHDDTP